jgi:hypothetical protein
MLGLLTPFGPEGARMAPAVVAESRYDPQCDTVEALDAGLVGWMRSGAPLRRALARIAGEVVRTRAWESLGFVRPADYARERARLPGLDEALTSGRLGWTKARLLCRVATPEDEGRWLEASGRLSAAALAREVRAIDTGGSRRAAPIPGRTTRRSARCCASAPRAASGRSGAR